MNILLLLLPLALTLGAVFAALFIAAARDGQFEDLDDPAIRMLQEDEPDRTTRPPQRK